MLPTLPNSDKSVTAAVIGTGHFATAVITQATAIPQLHVPVVVDLNVDAAQRAYASAGVDPTAVAVCESRAGGVKRTRSGTTGDSHCG
ncbi:MAG: hypothetical protein R2867_14770 [Caldilineaceae bacterium]